MAQQALEKLKISGARTQKPKGDKRQNAQNLRTKARRLEDGRAGCRKLKSESGAETEDGTADVKSW